MPPVLQVSEIGQSFHTTHQLVSFPYMGDEGFSTVTVEKDNISVRITPVWKLDPFLVAQTGAKFVKGTDMLRGECWEPVLAGAIDQAD